MARPKKSRAGSLWGIPHDWRKPTGARYKFRLWNPTDPRIFTPRAWGWGYDINFYRLFHLFTKDNRR